MPDFAQPLVVTKTTALTNVAEVDEAQVALDVDKALSIALATEADLAHLLRIRPWLTPAGESDGAQALAGKKAATLASAAETDSAQALSVTKPILKSLTPGLGISEAQPLGATKTATTAHAPEVDEALDLIAPATYSLTPALEDDASVALSLAKQLVVVLETSTAQALDRVKVVGLGAVAETDSALHLPRTWTFTAATESDEAYPLTNYRILALALVWHRVAHLAIAHEMDTPEVLPATHVMSFAATPVAELDSAQALSVSHDAAIYRELVAVVEV